MAIKAGIPLSPSVRNAIQRVGHNEPIQSWVLVRNLLAAHPEYGTHLGGKLTSEHGPESAEQRSVDQWVDALEELFEPSGMQLNGRVTILGLATIDPALRRYLESWGFLKAVEGELREPFEALLRKPPAASGEPTEGPATVQAAGASTARAVGSSGTGTVGRPVRLSGYSSDRVGEDLQDKLEIEHEVETIAHLLASKRVVPPLSLGLFGDWGTGKSFFMTKLRSYIKEIGDHYRKEENATGKPSEWCTRVLHIEFNAWHYSDANLWASLVTRIYQALQNELKQGPSDDAIMRQMQDEVRKAKGASGKAEAQLAEAGRLVETASTTLQQTRGKLIAQEKTLNTLIGNVSTLLSGDQKLKGELDTAARALGVPEAADAYESLVELHGSVKLLSGRTTAIATAVLRSPRTVLLLAVCAIALPLAVSWVLAQDWIDLDAVGRQVVTMSSVVVGVVAWLKAQVGRGVGFVQTVERALSDANDVRNQRMEQDPEVRSALKEVSVAEAAQEAARQNLEKSQAELQRLQSELAELAPERRLTRLLDDRARAGTYTQHLGIVSLIRDDFEVMSALFARLEKESRNLQVDPPPIQRIILYIDDLDRCRSERVVEVLEAVHMLLAFPLFSVVVGVDPRWLRESLARMHATTLTKDGAGGSSATYSTPQDYLEKIFQIPFALRRVEQQGYENLVTELIRSAEVQATPAAEFDANGSKAAAIDSNGDASGTPESDATAVPGEHETAGHAAESGTPHTGAPPVTRPFRPIQPNPFNFTKGEQEDIARLWPLFTTPRTVKRFINTYRLLRAGVSPSETDAFTGSQNEPGEYQIALLLLAIVSSAPNEIEAFTKGIMDWASGPDTTARNGREWHWNELLPELLQPGIDRDTDWADVDKAIHAAIREGFGRGFSKEQITKWLARVGRYTFSVLPPRSWNVNGSGAARDSNRSTENAPTASATA